MRTLSSKLLYGSTLQTLHTLPFTSSLATFHGLLNLRLSFLSSSFETVCLLLETAVAIPGASYKVV